MFKESASRATYNSVERSEADSVNIVEKVAESHLFLKSDFLQWLKRKLFTPDENSSSCVVESEADSFMNRRCAVNHYEKVAQLSF